MDLNGKNLRVDRVLSALINEHTSFKMELSIDITPDIETMPILTYLKTTEGFKSKVILAGGAIDPNLLYTFQTTIEGDLVRRDDLTLHDAKYLPKIRAHNSKRIIILQEYAPEDPSKFVCQARACICCFII